jgi:hypothetical protein
VVVEGSLEGQGKGTLAFKGPNSVAEWMGERQILIRVDLEDREVGEIKRGRVFRRGNLWRIVITVKLSMS